MAFPWLKVAELAIAGYGLFKGGKKSGSEKRLGQLSTAPFESNLIQGFLPPSLRFDQTGDFLRSGIQGIGDLIRNPGRLNPNVADAIRARLATTSEGIATNFRGIGQQQAGRAARTNVPISIRSALQSALDVAQSRSQRGARRGALAESEELRREDLSQVYAMLDSMLQFISSGRGQAIPGLSAAAQSSAQRRAANLAFIGSLFSSDVFTKKKSEEKEAA